MKYSKLFKKNRNASKRIYWNRTDINTKEKKIIILIQSFIILIKDILPKIILSNELIIHFIYFFNNKQELLIGKLNINNESTNIYDIGGTPDVINDENLILNKN